MCCILLCSNLVYNSNSARLQAQQRVELKQTKHRTFVVDSDEDVGVCGDIVDNESVLYDSDSNDSVLSIDYNVTDEFHNDWSWSNGKYACHSASDIKKIKSAFQDTFIDKYRDHG
eukprot:47319_1